MEKEGGALENMERLKIAITGASGFVGANLVRYLDPKHEVFALTRNANAWRLSTQFNLINLDIRRREILLEVINKLKPDVLIHCATYGGYNFEKETREIIETDIIGSLNVLDTCREIPIVINVGSSSEYGIKDRPMKEDDLTAPITPYAMSKALQTELFSSTRRSITLRLFSVYGYYEEKHRLIPYIIYSSLKNQKAVLSNEKSMRDFVFIEDVMKAFSLAIQKYEDINKGAIFNVGSGVQNSVRDVVDEMGVDVEWNSSARPKEPEHTWKADISKIKDELNWKPQYSLSDGLRKTKEWMERNIMLYEVEKNDKFARSVRYS